MKHSINKTKRVAIFVSALAAFPLANAQQNGYSSINGGTDGGAGGEVFRATTGTQIHEAICGRASNSTPLIIEVEGTINHGNTSQVSGSCNTADDRIELKDISNISIIGVGNGALFDELGIHIRNSSDIIIQNVHIRNVKKSGSPTSNGGDAIGMEDNVRNIWVDHVTLEASGGESDGYDSLFDLKNNTQYVTLSYSILRDSDRGGLVGSSDSDDQNNYITYHHNFYDNLNSRIPLLRHATAHSYNNYYKDIRSSGMNPRIGGRIRAENNYFEDSKDVLGTFYTDEPGFWDVRGNTFVNVEWSDSDDDYNPAGPNVESTTTIDISYSFDLDDTNCVPNIVQQTAGANNGILFSDGSCSVTSEPDEDDTDDSGDNGDDNDSGDNDNNGDQTGTNLSIGAGADGSSKASGSSYGNVVDQDLNTYWSPSESTGRISVKYGEDTTVSSVVIQEASGFQGNIGDWELVNHDTGETLASGNGIDGAINFNAVSLKKINLVINSSNGTPAVAEFETYSSASSDSSASSGETTSANGITLTTSADNGNAALSWSINDIDVRSIDIYRDNDSDPSGRTRIAAGATGSSYTDSDVSSGTYYYWLKVTDTDLEVFNSAATAIVLD